MSLLEILQVFACFLMTGVIWLVQVLVYPHFRQIPAELFARYHELHSRRITWIVGPAMLLELVTAVGLVWAPVSTSPFLILNLVGVILLWAHTAFIAIPLHERLAQQDQSAATRLIRANWFRTFLWSLRSAAWIGVLVASTWKVV